MSDRRRAALQVIGAVMAATLLVALLDILTNSLDTARFSWDFRYYIDMAKRGLMPPLASPFAYRYVTPLLVRVISLSLHVPVEVGFVWIARISACAQLVGVFLLARWYSKSARAGWLAMLVAAFSLFQVKFLLFDTFRPDHLAYPLILLQVFLAMSGRFWLLWAVTLLGCQIREFAAIPLVAWVFATLWEVHHSAQPAGRHLAYRQTIVSGIGLTLALLLPRLLIPVSEDFQFASFTRDGLLRVALAPLVLARDANFIYSALAYALPILMLVSLRQLHAAWKEGRAWDSLFLGAYGALVLVFSFLGGTDFFRFSTYLLPPMALLLVRLTDSCTRLQLAVMLAAVFVFNRIWLPFPNTDVEGYLDFYGGFGTRFNLASAVRAGELAAFLGLGLLLRRAANSSAGNIPPSSR